MSTFLADIRYGLRMLVKNPGVTSAAVLSLSIGVGANTTVFSWIQGLFLRPFPKVEAQGRLVQLVTLPKGGSYTSISYPNYVESNETSQLLEGIIATSSQEFSLRVATLSENMKVALAFQRMAAVLLGVFGVLALILACIGIYGVMSFMVARRTQEIGIRVALGAGTGDVLRLVLRQGLTLAFFGGVVGLLAAWAVTRFLSGLLLGVSAPDPVVFGLVSMVLAMAVGLANTIPARRASRVDPLVALKYE